ncbi:MAG: GNAT family N-acetyltransferase [Hyphomicrobiales bacterium]|nr:MAG: GNAT family N-acetyltransferase [Hyphomicrobiales bacterium]
MSDILYARDPGLTVDEYVDVVGHSELGATRPISDRERVARMIASAGLVVTARLDGRCIGLTRCITDFAWTAYLCDLAVHEDFQGRGIGRGLVQASKDVLGDEVGLALFSMPGAVPFYDRLEPMGMKRNPDGYFWSRTRGA